MKKNKMTFREKMNSPYTKGDYYRSVATAFGIWAVGVAACVVIFPDEARDYVETVKEVIKERFSKNEEIDE